MAPKAPTTPPTAGSQTSADTTSQPANGTPPAFTWDKLADSKAMPNRTVFTPFKVDVIGKIHPAIRERAESSLAINTDRVAKADTSAATRKRVNYHWDVQPIPDTKTGEDFRKILTKYARYRPSEGDIPFAHADSASGQVTARHGDPVWYVDGEDGVPVASDEHAEGAYLGVRYSVRPFEARKDTKAVGTPG